MNDIQTRVSHCFSTVFPGIAPEEVAGASTTSLQAWDSLGHIRLLSALEEEFHLQCEMQDFDDLVSYSLIVAYLEAKQNG